MQSHYSSPLPQEEHLPAIRSIKGPLHLSQKPKIVLKRLQSETRQNIRLSWTSKLMNWKAILDDQKEYRELITKIELYNQKLKVQKRRKRVSPH
ncbi:hypothetical protein SteCoe_7203 [Stentor coeruleus]|uniref:Uncharacterized protein n=1 Tax=Stentor coeruleus TaxID=5963 RepID=A0A1R2CN40_9CILI|nr:hypothetical protein SteCoe_7203 [Stentor coeruleus]